MELSKEWVGEFIAPTGQIALVVSRFNQLMSEQLLYGAQDALLRHGVANHQIEIVRVPGAFELPFVCQQLAQTKRFVGIVALGTIIRGSTAHFDYVASSCTQGIQQAQLTTQVPMTLGVLTTETIEQALERAGSKAGNKGYEAAMVLLEMINLLGKIHE